MCILKIYPDQIFLRQGSLYLQGLIRVDHRQNFVSGVNAAQLAQRAEQPLTGPAIEQQLLLVVIRAGQDLSQQTVMDIEGVTHGTFGDLLSLTQ